ncbi:MAG: glycosyltransferase family 2 protein [Paludibacteraceae bacterium]
MNSPLVSIITPTYNHENYISDCIESVQHQTYVNWEMIIIDDGSTDNTYSVALEYAANDNRIQVYTQENVGIFRLCESYNFALSKSKGEYITVLEGDDIWLSEKLELQVNALENDDNVVLAWGQAIAVSADLSRDLLIAPNKKYQEDIFNNTPVKSSLKELILSNFIPALTVFIRRSALEKTGGFIQSHNLPLIDMPTWQQLAFLGTFAYINQPLGKWRVSSIQVTKTYTVDMIWGVYQLALEIFSKNKEFFEKNGVTESKIHVHFKKRLIVNRCHAGNFKLNRNDYKGARNDFLMAIKSYGLYKMSWKVRACIGLIKTYYLQMSDKS